MALGCWIAVVLATQRHLNVHNLLLLSSPLDMGPLQSLLASTLAFSACIEPARGACRISAKGAGTGADNIILLRGTVLTSAGALSDNVVVVDSGRITYVGNLGGVDPDAKKDVTVIECGDDSVISPGFINTHEHIAYSTVRPFQDLGVRVNHRHDWRVGARNNTRRPSDVNGTEADATRWGELRHLFSGTTSIVGGDMTPGLVRNLDYIAGLGAGLVAPVATWDVFPLDNALGTLRVGDCDYGPDAVDRETAGKLGRYMAHVGEGIDAEAANEFRCLSSETFDVTPAVANTTTRRRGAGGGLSTDLVAPNLVLVHALGLSEADFDLVASRGAHVVWSPRSNVFLYGKTLNVTYLLDAGINVALGTDWLPSGSATMAREAVCGLSATRKSYGVGLESRTLWEMMTINAARAAGFEGHLGSLEAGKLADIVVLSGGGGSDPDNSEEAHMDPFSRAIYAAGEQVELVMRGGKIMVAGEGLEDLASASRASCETAMFGDARKIVCVSDELGSSFADFEASLGGVYPAILPEVPPDEPSCEPSR